MVRQSRFYFANPDRVGHYVNRWDFLILVLVFAILFFWVGLDRKWRRLIN